MTNLSAKGFVLNDEQFISYYSAKTKNYIAAAKNPIPSDAIIPKSDIKTNGRLILKIWPLRKLPESSPIISWDNESNDTIDQILGNILGDSDENTLSTYASD